MSDRDLWALMQRIETLHYRAECLEKASTPWPSPWRDVAFHVAGRIRQFADRLYVSGRSGAA